MIEKTIDNSQAGYSRPRCEFVVMTAQKVLCASGYGDAGYAGMNVQQQNGGSLF